MAGIELQELKKTFDNNLFKQGNGIVKDYSQFEDKYLGTLGNASFMSMQGSKAISAGEGGLLLTNSTD